MSNKVYVPHLSTVGSGGVKGMFLPLVSRSVEPVCFKISPLYQIISDINFTSLAIICPFQTLRELCKHHVRDPDTVTAPGSEKKVSPELHIK